MPGITTYAVPSVSDDPEDGADVQFLLAPEEELDDIEEAPATWRVVNLWDPEQGSVSGGVNYGDPENGGE